jgi:ATP-dependent helicase/nuclease subunit A
MSEQQPAYQHNGKPVFADAFYAIACDPARSVAVEACAGAGKTWMLVSRIIRALLDGVDATDGHLRVQPHEILAITFTKRAASEMRERLYQWLEAFAAADHDTLLKELNMRGVQVKKGLQPSLDMPEQLSNLYQSVLACGRQVQIRTFHSWFAALLRSAPLAVLQQLELPLNYELLEDDAPARALVWRRFYAALAVDVPRKADFESVVFDYGRAQTLKALETALDKRVEFALADARGVVDASVQGFDVLYPAFSGLQSPVQALEGDVARARWLGWAKALGGEANKTPQKAAGAVIDAFALQDLNARLDTLRKAFFVAKEDRLTSNLQKFAAAQEAEPELQRLCAARHQHDAWQYQQRMARLTRVLIAEFAALKRERGWVDMNDVERAALVMLGDPVLSGWVQQRLDARIKHLLIDEFQDTNPLQWQALLSWLGSYAGTGGGSQAPSVFIVGDPKQSIYRFRRAEPQVFRAAQAFVREGLGGDLLSCDHTRRNARQVMATVNATMAVAREEDHYEGFREHTTSSTDAGSVGKLPPIPRDPRNSRNTGDAPEGATERDPVWRDSLTTPRETVEDTVRTLEARQAARWVAGQVGAGLPPEEIMVLSRKRAGLLPLQDELRALGIPAQIGEKTELIACCEVLDVVALLDVLVSPQHDLSLARALKSPIFGLPDESLVELALLRREINAPWFDLLQKTELLAQDLQGLSAILMRWKAWLDQLPPHDALQAIYADGDVLARFAVAAPATQRDTVLANLQSLVGMSLQMGGGRFATPYAFVRALKAGGVVAPAAVNPQAVRLLTIHGAKGLEAQAVLLLDTDTPERNAETMGVLVDWPGEAAFPARFVFLASESQPPACAVPTLEAERAERGREELNALYVALTRARHTLVMSSIAPHRDAQRSWWQRLNDLMPEVTNLPDVAQHVSALPPARQAAFSIKELPPAPVKTAQAAIETEADIHAAEDNPVASRIGQAMHRLLEWGDASASNASAAAREFELSPEQGAQALSLAQRILHGAGAWVWDNAVVGWQENEVELMYQGEPLRLDRLVQRKDTLDWWVLDYKSAHAPQDEPELVAQLQNYRDAVQAIYPHATVKAAFLTGHGELVPLPA